MEKKKFRRSQHERPHGRPSDSSAPELNSIFLDSFHRQSTEKETEYLLQDFICQ